MLSQARHLGSPGLHCQGGSGPSKGNFFQASRSKSPHVYSKSLSKSHRRCRQLHTPTGNVEPLFAPICSMLRSINDFTIQYTIHSHILPYALQTRSRPGRSKRACLLRLSRRVLWYWLFASYSIARNVFDGHRDVLVLTDHLSDSLCPFSHSFLSPCAALPLQMVTHRNTRQYSQFRTLWLPVASLLLGLIPGTDPGVHFSGPVRAAVVK